jgi:hypothetical protein
VHSDYREKVTSAVLNAVLWLASFHLHFMQPC